MIEPDKPLRTMCCPRCGHSVFIRKTFEEVEIIDNGESMNDEVININFDAPEYKCKKCDEYIEEEELVPMDELGEIIKEKLLMP